ncbi:MAG: VWA domain-containing protein [Gammaproteobacteria bacterium]|nr:VWA domain-containing protein [Gammaproteobacteria bacterium]MBQ0840784.1 VWA domain-containing protein [Gammaproteobacteria bacterium]
MNLGLLEEKFSALDALPDALYDVVITHTHGALLTRARGVLQWREKLLAGRLPEMDELCWPEEELRKVLLMRLETLEIAEFCLGQERLTDSVLKDICEGISSAEDYLAKTGDKFKDKLAQRQKIKDKDSSFRDEEGLADHVQNRTPQPSPQEAISSPVSDQNTTDQNATGQKKPDNNRQNAAQNKASTPTHNSQTPNTGAPKRVNAKSKPLKTAENQLQNSREKNAAGQVEQQISKGEKVVNQLQQRWQNLADNWAQVSKLDRQIELSNNAQQHSLAADGRHGGERTTKSLPGRGWDLSTGLLTSQGWRDIIRYRQRIKELPELIHFIDAIGREKKITGNDKPAAIDNKAQSLAPSRQPGNGERGSKVPRKALEMDGIERGDDINRMLPSELALLCHPLLKTLWHAKRAERLLLLYQHQGKRREGEKDTGARQEKSSLNKQGHKGQSSLRRGPIIICLDTSGSMHGEPEHIAKAAVLEALKIAHREQRPCHLFAFSGPQQSTFHQLDLRRGGLIELLNFLQFSFHGGTDLPQALTLALEKQAEEGWEKADILLVSDGRFPIDSNTFKAIEGCKKARQLRLFGILTGNWQHSGMQDFCDDTLRIRG